MTPEENDRPNPETPIVDSAASPLDSQVENSVNSSPSPQPSKPSTSPDSSQNTPFENRSNVGGAPNSETRRVPNGAPGWQPNFGRRPTPPFLIPPRPLGFGAQLLKNVLTTVAGVFAFFFLAFFSLIFGLALVLAILDAESTASDLVAERVVSGDDDATGKIAIVPIEGVIESDEWGFLRETVDILRGDDRVRAVVLRVNSPGGTVSGSDYYYNLFKDLKIEREIPIVVSMGDVAASGGYYISAVGDKIFAERTSETGSIGVIIPMYDASTLCEKLGVGSTPVVSGAMKGMGDFMKKPTPEERAIFQNLVDETYEQFLDVVREGRPWFRGEDGDAPKPRRANVGDVAIQTFVETTKSDSNAENAENAENANSSADADRDAELRKIADGRIYTARQAKELHLIDEIGFLDDAVDEAIALAGLDPDSTQVVRYEEIESWTDAFGLASATSNGDRLEKAARTMAAPKAYYLAPRALPIGE